MNSALLINNGTKSELTFFRSEVRGGNLPRSGYGGVGADSIFLTGFPEKPLVMVDRSHEGLTTIRA